MARLVIKNTGATAVWLSDVTQSEGLCPLSVHPIMRRQTLIVIMHYDPSLVPFRVTKRQYISCLHIHIFLRFYSFDFLNFSSQQVFILRFKSLSIMRPEDRHLFFRFSGQKFVMLEFKSTMSQALRCFKVIRRDTKEELHASLHFNLKNVSGLKVKLQKH